MIKALISFVTLEFEEYSGVGGKRVRREQVIEKRGGVKRGGGKNGVVVVEEEERGQHGRGGMIVRGAETVAERARGREEAAKEQISS